MCYQSERPNVVLMNHFHFIQILRQKKVKHTSSRLSKGFYIIIRFDSEFKSISRYKARWACLERSQQINTPFISTKAHLKLPPEKTKNGQNMQTLALHPIQNTKALSRQGGHNYSSTSLIDGFFTNMPNHTHDVHNPTLSNWKIGPLPSGHVGKVQYGELKNILSANGPRHSHEGGCEPTSMWQHSLHGHGRMPHVVTTWFEISFAIKLMLTLRLGIHFTFGNAQIV